MAKQLPNEKRMPEELKTKRGKAWAPRADEMERVRKLGLELVGDKKPLPEWAEKIIGAKGVSKANKLHLLKVQNILIKRGFAI